MFLRILFPLAVIAVAAVAGFVPGLVGEHVAADPTYQPSEIEAAKESIALSLMGQLQLSVGDLMWMKSMEYLHMGVVQRMPTQSEEARGFRRRDAQNVAAGLGHTEGVNMVLDAERDWRGWLGDIERHVKPYMNEHRHDDPVELIPWYQLAVRLNPSLERLYTLGAFYLSDFANEPGEALEMLEAGLKANPYSFELHAGLGRLLFEYHNRLDLLEHDHGDGGHSHDDDDHHDDDHHDDFTPADYDHAADEHRKTREEVGHDHAFDAADFTVDLDSDDPYHVHTPEEALHMSVYLLERAAELGENQRQELARRREIFDDFQNQMFGETFLFLSRALLALGRFEEAIEVAEHGFDAASQYSQRNLLRAQARIAQRERDGLAADPADLMRIASAAEQARYENVLDAPQSGAPRPEHDTDTIVYPVSVIIGAEPPPQARLGQPEGVEAELLADIRARPLMPLHDRDHRIRAGEDALDAAAARLLQRGFAIEEQCLEGSPESPCHRITAPGLYVAMGAFGFDFWEEMERQENALRARGIVLPGDEEDETEDAIQVEEVGEDELESIWGQSSDEQPLDPQ